MNAHEGKRILCDCGMEIVFWGETPHHHICNRCKAKIKIEKAEKMKTKRGRKKKQDSSS